MDKSEVTMKYVYMLIKEVNGNLGQRIERIVEATNNLSTVIFAEVENIKAKVQNLEKENEQLKKRLSTIERKAIITNLVFYGKHEATNDRPENLAEKIRELVLEKLKFPLDKTDINNIFRLGKRSNYTRLILLSLTTYLKKQKILRNSHKLKGTKISVSGKLLEKELKERQISLEGLKEEKNNSQKATIRGNKLIVEENIYSAAKIQSILSNRDEEFPVISTRQISSEPPTPFPKEFEIEEEETVIPLKTSLIETELEEAKHRSQGRTGKEEYKIKPSKTRQLSVNDAPKNHSSITRTLRTHKK
ncbi:hypothetical protein JTB14_031330 [Gonioctena quinquepunctata]|nr:hypothetical protein JTB14_031330 [Gonioctena quinquepunctata]